MQLTTMYCDYVQNSEDTQQYDVAEVYVGTTLIERKAGMVMGGRTKKNELSIINKFPDHSQFASTTRFKTLNQVNVQTRN